MNNKQILDNAPDWANEYHNEKKYGASIPNPTRSLADIKRIAELENAIEEAGSWLSAAQECEKTCLECQQAFLNLINIKAKGGE